MYKQLNILATGKCQVHLNKNQVNTVRIRSEENFLAISYGGNIFNALKNPKQISEAYTNAGMFSQFSASSLKHFTALKLIFIF